MGVAVLTALTLSLAAPATHAASTDDVLGAVASSCPASASASERPTVEVAAMRCGIAVVRRSSGLAAVHSNRALDRSALLKADAIRRCGFSHTPCGASFTRTFQRVGYLSSRSAVGENLAWGQGPLGSPVQTLRAWLDSPPHRENLLSPRWRDAGIAVERGTMLGHTGVTLWVLQLGRRG